MIFIVFITNSERRIPVQYAKRVVGRKMYGGQTLDLVALGHNDRTSAQKADAVDDLGP